MFAETEHERALEAACRPLIVRKPIIGGDMDTLLGWDFIGGGDFRPEVREAVSAAYDLPIRPREAWEEWQGWDRLYRDREAFFRDYGFPVWVEARRHVVEELLNEAPAKSMNDLRARLSWIDYLKSIDVLGQRPRDDALLATLRADIERMGARIRDEAAPVQNGQRDTSEPVSSPDLGSATPPVQYGHPRRTNAEKRRDVLALLNVQNAGIASLSDREIARRAGVSPQTVGNIRRRR